MPVSASSTLGQEAAIPAFAITTSSFLIAYLDCNSEIAENAESVLSESMVTMMSLLLEPTGRESSAWEVGC